MSNICTHDIEIAQRGKAHYQSLRVRIEVPDNIGKIIAIDIETGDYEIGDDLLEVSLKLKSRHPNAEMWAERIGFNAVYSVGETVIVDEL